VFLPLSTNVEMRRPPIANGAIIFGCVVVFLATRHASVDEVKPFILDGWNPLGLFGNIWLHADLIHLGGNMLFLWVFGNAVCSRVRNLWYLAAYVALGLAADASHLLLDGRPALGASGAINGVVGLFIVLFPLSRLNVSLMLGIVPVKRFTLPSLLVVGLWFLFDLYGLMEAQGNIGYTAHVGGFIAGVILGGILLDRNWVTLYAGEESIWDVLGLTKRVRPAADAAADVPPLHPETPGGGPAPSHFTPWRQAAGAAHFRCPCGASLAREPGQTETLLRCPRCGKRVRVPPPSPA
jgi:membrane associated rhomboid family serine protease